VCIVVLVNAVASVQPGDVLDCVDTRTWQLGPGPAALQGTYRGSRVAVIECAIATTTNSAALACSIEPRHGSSIFRLPSTGPLEGDSNHEI
jgi:hypothetical protein